MIKIDKIDAVYSYISYFVSVFSKVIVIPFILAFVTDDEYALWAVFLSIEGFVTLFDMGVAKLVARYATYAYCGAAEIPIEGMPQKPISGTTNYELFFEVYYIAKRFYRKISFYATLIILCGTVYIYYLSRELNNIWSILLAWFIFGGSVAFQLYFTYISSFLKGMGKIKETKKIDLYAAMIEIVLKLVLIVGGMGILGLGIANCVLIIFKRFSMTNVFNKTITGSEKEKKWALKKYQKGELKQVEKAFEKNSKDLGGVVIAQYIQGQGSTLLCSMIFTLSETAQYSLTLQLYNVVSSLAQIPYQVLQPKLNEYRLTKNKERLKDFYSLIVLYIWIIFAFAIFFISFLANPVLSIIKSNTFILPTSLSILVGIYQMLDINHRRSTDLIGLGNEQPYTKAYIISALATIVVSAVVLIFDMGITELILGNLLIQLSYNAWKWPMYVNKLFDIKRGDIIKRGSKTIISQLNKKKEREC